MYDNMNISYLIANVLNVAFVSIQVRHSQSISKIPLQPWQRRVATFCLLTAHVWLDWEKYAPCRSSPVLCELGS